MDLLISMIGTFFLSLVITFGTLALLILPYFVITSVPFDHIKKCFSGDKDGD